MAKTAEQKAAAKAAKDAKKAAAKAAAPAAVSVDADPAAVAQPAPEGEAPAKGDIVVKYRDHKGEETSRTFSKEVHGKDFAKLAQEFTSGYFHVFSSPMLAFKEGPAGLPTPGPWVPVESEANSRRGHVELAITNTKALNGLSPLMIAWLVAALLRLRAESPVRAVVISNQSLATLPKSKEPWVQMFEPFGDQSGLFRQALTKLTDTDIAWLSKHDESYLRLHCAQSRRNATSTYEDRRSCSLCRRFSCPAAGWHQRRLSPSPVYDRLQRMEWRDHRGKLASAQNVGRRLRELVNDGKVLVEYRKNHAYYSIAEAARPKRQLVKELPNRSVWVEYI